MEFCNHRHFLNVVVYLPTFACIIRLEKVQGLLILFKFQDPAIVAHSISRLCWLLTRVGGGQGDLDLGEGGAALT